MYQVKIQTTSLALRQISSRDHLSMWIPNREEICLILLKQQSVKSSTTKSYCMLYHNMWSARNPAILLQKKLLDEVIYTLKTICSQTTTKAFGKISIFSIQLTKKGTFS